MKRTAAGLSLVLILGMVLPGVSAYASAACRMPCHPAPAGCHHHSQASAWAVQCDCHHAGNEQLPARLENNPQPVTSLSAVSGLAPGAADRFSPSNSDRTSLPFPRASIFCLTRSYRI